MGNYIKGIQYETNQDIGHTLASIWSPNEDSLSAWTLFIYCEFGLWEIYWEILRTEPEMEL